MILSVFSWFPFVGAYPWSFSGNFWSWCSWWWGQNGKSNIWFPTIPCGSTRFHIFPRVDDEDKKGVGYRGGGYIWFHPPATPSCHLASWTSLSLMHACLLDWHLDKCASEWKYKHTCIQVAVGPSWPLGQSIDKYKLTQMVWGSLSNTWRRIVQLQIVT